MLWKLHMYHDLHMHMYIINGSHCEWHLMATSSKITAINYSVNWTMCAKACRGYQQRTHQIITGLLWGKPPATGHLCHGVIKVNLPGNGLKHVLTWSRIWICHRLHLELNAIHCFENLYVPICFDEAFVFSFIRATEVTQVAEILHRGRQGSSEECCDRCKHQGQG